MRSSPATSGTSRQIHRLVGQLEALLLLLLRRAHAQEGWDVRRTAERLYASEAEAAEILARLYADG